MPDLAEAMPVVALESVDWEQAAKFLEQSVRAGNPDPQAAYLLAMCFKRLNRLADARHLLSKIQNPDAEVLLQRGVLAFKERDYPQAAQEFERCWRTNPASFPAAYNLMLSRLCQGQTAPCLELLSRLTDLAPDQNERRFLLLLRALLSVIHGSDRERALSPDQGAQQVRDQEHILHTLTQEDEMRLVDMLGGLGQFDIAFPLLSHLVSLRPASEVAFTAYFGAALVQAKHLIDQHRWEEAFSLLASLTRRLENANAGLDNLFLVELHQLLGACSCLLQDYERGAWYFRTALEHFQKELRPTPSPQRLPLLVSPRGVYQGALLEQNLALAYEWQGRLDTAEQHWHRYFDYLEHYFPSSKPADYLPKLAFEGLSRLGDVYGKKEKWQSALGFLQRASRLRPNDGDLLERLFQHYSQLKKHDDARRTLKKLRETRPNDPQVDLFELEVREVRGVEDVEQMMADLRKILQQHPGDVRVEERAAAATNNLAPLLEKVGEQNTAQLNKVLDQMRRLPDDKINWTLVRDVMRDLEDKFLRLRRACQRCLGLITAEELRRDMNALVQHCERKIDQCHRFGE